MSEEILRALMQLFAIIAKVDKDGNTGSSKSIVESYLKQHLNTKGQEEYLKLFDEFVRIYHYGTDEQTKNNKRISSNSVKVLMICQQINTNLQQTQKVVVLLQLLEFIKNGYDISPKEKEFVETVSEVFNFNEKEYLTISHFIFNIFDEIPHTNYLLISDLKDKGQTANTYREGLNGNIHILYIKSVNMYAFKYIGTTNLYMNGANIPTNRTLILDNGSSIRSSKTKPIYYSNIAGQFHNRGETSKFLLTVTDVEYRFKNSNNGIKKCTFSEESGELICIMGGSGVGKSTLLNILNGKIKPQSGSVTINGIDIYKEKERLKGIIGFVPQDDMLIEELTVYQNIYYAARLCFANLSETQLKETVDKLLSDLDLIDVKELQVGHSLNKFISGGQRKRLNIALELIREPAILLVDEPTSGLSSMDSEMVMDLLKEQALKGKLVITNIHQPSSNIYKMFDKLILLDRGGYLIYYGNPIDAISYFKRRSNFVMADESECLSCGNVTTEQILQIVETKVIDEYGKLTKTRKVQPKEWYEIFVSEIQSKTVAVKNNNPLPVNNFKLPSAFEQFWIFIIRNVLSKLTNKQYLYITFLEAPILALILSFFSKYIAGNVLDSNQFVFSQNENLPAFLFMSVVCALFIGLTISAEEIIKDRKLLERERFLNLSNWSYLNSKISLLFIISAIQTLSFIIIGNWILEIHSLSFNSFIILFSTACFANMLGLNISAGLNSVVTIYIIIPFILVPQLLLSGVIVKFEKLHKSIANYQYVSIAGDLMTSRWAYEAMAVNQFENNLYQRHFYNIERKMSDATFHKDYLIPKLLTSLEYCKTSYSIDSLKTQTIHNLDILKTEISLLSKIYGYKFAHINSLQLQSFNANTYNQTKLYLQGVKNVFNEKYDHYFEQLDEKCAKMIKDMGKDQFIKLKTDNYNEAIADQVKNNKELDKIVQKGNRFIQYMEPVYIKPEHPFGRTPMYASRKLFLGKEIDTVWFNIAVIWLGTLILYILLLNNSFSKCIHFFNSIFKRNK